MTIEFDFPERAEDRIVYIRPVGAEELSDDLRDDLDLSHPVYAIHGADGARLALTRDRARAFALARGNSYTPVSVH